MRGSFTNVTKILGTLIMLVTFGSAVGGLGGCSPTKSGIENRASANARMSLVGAQVHYEQAQQQFATGQLDKAINEIERAILRYPDMGSYYLLKGRILVEQSRLEQALTCFNTTLEICAKPSPLAAEAEPSASEEGAPESQMSPENTEIAADAHYYTGVVYQRWSEDQEAYAAYLEAFTLVPDKVHYLLAAAESLIALGRYDEAEALIEPKMDYFEHNAALRQLQAQIAMLQGDARSAAELYADARLLSPDDDSLLEEMMWAQWAAGLYAQCYETASTLKTRLEMGSSHRPSQNGNLNPQPQARPDLTLLQARCLSMMSRGVEARQLYLELTKIRPTDAALWSELGTLAWELGDYRSLASASTQMLAIAPERYEGYLFRAVTERQKGNDDEALRLLREACDHAGTSPAGAGVVLPFLMLGQVLEQRGDRDGAQMAYNNAVSADPNSAQAASILRRFNESQRQVTVVPEE